MQKVEVDDCGAAPCVFCKGNRYKVRVTFMPECSSNDIILTRTAKVIFDVTLDESSGAEIGMSAVTAGQAATFTYEVDAPTHAPTNSTTEAGRSPTPKARSPASRSTPRFAPTHDPVPPRFPGRHPSEGPAGAV
ncbi:hypothetical protein [Streptomyces sp. NPDC055287]